MKNTLHTFEQGLLRLYYVAWAIIAPTWFVMAFYEERDRLFFNDLFSFGYVGLLLIITVVLPWVGMKLFQWIYRGFVPKQ